MPSKGLRTERDNGTPVGFQALTVSSNAAGVGLTLPANQMVTYALVECQGQPIVVRFDGPAPTTTVGHIYNPGQTDVWNFQEILKALMIRQGGADGTLAVTYYKS